MESNRLRAVSDDAIDTANTALREVNLDVRTTMVP